MCVRRYVSMPITLCSQLESGSLSREYCNIMTFVTTTKQCLAFKSHFEQSNAISTSKYVKQLVEGHCTVKTFLSLDYSAFLIMYYYLQSN